MQRPSYLPNRTAITNPPPFTHPFPAGFPAATPTRYAAYARVSTAEQAERGKSIEDQLARLTHEAEARGGTLVATFADPGCSGGTLRRPQLAALLAFCKDGNADAVLVVDTDRLARRTEHHFAIKAQLRKCGVRVESLNQPMIDDTPEGVFLDTILAATNALYPQITGRKTSLAMAAKAEAGWWPGPARLGYRNADNPAPTSANDRRVLIPNEQAGPLVTRAFALYATGRYSLKSLCAELNARGLRGSTGARLSTTSLRKLLGDPFYVGKAPYKGQVRTWRHLPLTDEDTFQRCQLVLAAHNRYADRMRKHSFLLSGLLTCGICGAPLTASVNARKGKAYYHCPLNRAPHSNAGQNTPVEDLDRQAGALFARLPLTPKMVEGLIERARRMLEATHGDTDVKRRELAAQKALLEGRRERLEAAFLDGQVTPEAYRRQADGIEASLRTLGLELARLDLGREANVGVFEQLLRMAADVRDSYEHAPAALRRAYLALCWERIVVRDRRIVEAVPTQALALVLGVDAVRPREDTVEEDTKTVPRPQAAGPQQEGEAVIKSGNWLPAPSTFITSGFITLLRDAAYWDRVRRLLPAPSA